MSVQMDHVAKAKVSGAGVYSLGWTLLEKARSHRVRQSVDSSDGAVLRFRQDLYDTLPDLVGQPQELLYRVVRLSKKLGVGDRQVHEFLGSRNIGEDAAFSSEDLAEAVVDLAERLSALPPFRRGQSKTLAYGAMLAAEDLGGFAAVAQWWSQPPAVQVPPFAPAPNPPPPPAPAPQPKKSRPSGLFKKNKEQKKNNTGFALKRPVGRPPKAGGPAAKKRAGGSSGKGTSAPGVLRVDPIPSVPRFSDPVSFRTRSQNLARQVDRVATLRALEVEGEGGARGTAGVWGSAANPPGVLQAVGLAPAAEVAGPSGSVAPKEEAVELESGLELVIKQEPGFQL